MCSTKSPFKEIACAWLADKAAYVKQATYAIYALQVEKHLLPYFGGRTDMTEEDLQQFILDKIKNGLGQKTIKDLVVTLKMIYRYAVKHYQWSYIEMELRYPVEYKPLKLQVLPKQEQRKIMQYIQEHFTFRNLGIFICLSTGLRIGELCALKWKDIDLSEEVVRVSRSLQRLYFILPNGQRETQLVEGSPKTKCSIREIPISRDLKRMIKPLMGIVNPEYYVLTNDSKATEPRVYRSYYHSLMEQLDMPRIKFHGLRHSFATRCIESGCDYKTVSTLLGHSNISTTLNLYVHPDLLQKRRCIEQMTKSLG